MTHAALFAVPLILALLAATRPVTAPVALRNARKG